jgi:hypothetical protein
MSSLNMRHEILRLRTALSSTETDLKVANDAKTFTIGTVPNVARIIADPGGTTCAWTLAHVT